MLTALGAGATKVQHMLSGAGLMMGDPDGFGVFSSRLVHSEYEAMTTWWCGLKEPQRPANSALCARRALAQRLKGLSGEAKKAAMKAQPQDHSPEARKAMSEEAKRMVNAYCKGSQAIGATTTVCARTLGVLEMGKRLFKKAQDAAVTSG